MKIKNKLVEVINFCAGSALDSEALVYLRSM